MIAFTFSSLQRAAGLTAALLLGGCADLSYYMHSINGHYAIINQTRSIESLLHSEDTDAQLAERLRLVQQIRKFAFTQLHLPQSDSYSLYADLERNYVLKNLFAAEEFSIQPYQWCYPIVGCAGYRGYFDEQRMRRYVANLEGQGFDIHVAKVPAYSTLGWFDDPVLNTFIFWPEHRLAGLIFHELTHQLLFVDGDSMFNESFAVAVQQVGIERWLESHRQFETLTRFRASQLNRRRVIGLIESTRARLHRLYGQPLDDNHKRAAKQRIIDGLRSSYQQMAAGFSAPDGFERWFKQDINNAKLASVSTYHARVPAFRVLLTHHGNDLNDFYRHVEAIATLPAAARDACLLQWMPTKPENEGSGRDSSPLSAAHAATCTGTGASDIASGESTFDR